MPEIEQYEERIVITLHQGLEDCNLASPLELDVLVHVEEEHEGKEEADGGKNVPHLFRIRMKIYGVQGTTVMMMRTKMRWLTSW